MSSIKPEVQALMMGMESESESDSPEFIPLGSNGASPVARNGNSTKRHMRRERGGLCSLRERVVRYLLILSLVINLVLLLILVVVVRRARNLPADCPQDLSGSVTLAVQLGDSKPFSSSPFSTSLPSASSSIVSPTTRSPTTTTTTTSSTITIPDPLPARNLTCLTSAVTCGQGSAHVQQQQQQTAPKDEGYVNVFRDLSSEEMAAAVQYLLRQPSLNVHLPAAGFVSSIFGVELHVPVKDLALEFLDSPSTSRPPPPPPREALVTLAMNGESPPVVRQYVVGALPRPSYHRPNPRMSKAVPASRLSFRGLGEAYAHVQQQLGYAPGVNALLRESFEVTPADCRPAGKDDRSPRPCVTLLGQKISFGLVDEMTFSFTLYYNAEFPIVHPLPFQVLVTVTPSLGSSRIISVNYAGSTFSSLQELVRLYRQGQVPKVRMRYPRGEGSVPGSMNLRGEPFPRTPHSPPRQYEPQGPRFSVENQHVKYLEWSFNVRVSVESGPQLWDVKWSGERIVYELSLQEIAVLYAGANPAAMFAHLSDSAFGLGDKTKPLVPGVDCPDHARFLSTWIFSGGNAASPAKELPHSVCVFEHNSGRPLRRHSSTFQGEKQYYGGLVDNFLVVRVIIVEFNYDYILDFVFHANGALESRVYATGYVMAQWFHYGEDPFGFEIKNDTVGSVHHHLFHFKLDLDIGGVANRYETLDFNTDDRNWPWLSALKPSATSSSSSSSSSFPSSSSPRSFQQISFKHHLRKSEKDALYHYNFDRPKYHVFYNDRNKNQFGNVRTYRLEARGFSKQLLPSEHPAVRSRKWANHCMAVTERKETEMKSSSIFSMYDADDPVVDFDDFVADNDSIVDKDLVSWVTLGMHHIPHTEDIPNTPTVGTEASILLLPFNYFPECPSVRSRDAVRAERSSTGNTRFTTYGTESDFSCFPPVYGWLKASKARSYP